MDAPADGSPPARLVALLAGHDLFRAFDAAAFADLETELEPLSLARGEVLIRQGDAADGMYVLTGGRLGVRIAQPTGDKTAVDELLPGATVGEMALLTGQPRAATVYALEDAELVRLSRAGFDRLAERRPKAVQGLARSIRPRLERTQLAAILTDLFGALDAAAIHELQAALEWLHLPGGATLFRQGEPGDALYIVVNGRLRLTVEQQDGAERVIGEVTRGASVGDLALLTGEPQAATVYAIRDTDLFKITRDRFTEVAERYPRAGLQIARNTARGALLAVRGLGGRGAGAAPATTFALVPTNDDAPLAEVARQLVETLERSGPTLHLSGAHFDRLHGRPEMAQLPDDHPAHVAIAGWLGEQERRYRFVVYEADHEWSRWTRRCVRQADRVLLVGRAGTDPRPGASETAMGEGGPKARLELVLVQPEQAERPRGTRRWLAERRVHAHHHVRLGDRGDFQRLARRLTGHAVGLVLSGGGMRGCAHLGVIRALEEAGLAVDLIGGTSMGAHVAALYALHRDSRQLVKLAETFLSRKRLLDPTLPILSFFASRKMTEVLQHVYGDVEIEDLWQPFFCVSSNLSRAAPVVHEDGPLWQAIRASMAIPGIFAPVLHNGDVLVDGAVMDNFPLGLMRERVEGGLVVGVLASPVTDKVNAYDFGPSVSGWQLLWTRVNPFATRLRTPSLFGTLFRTMEINAVHRLRSKAFTELADLLIRPEVERFQILDFGAYAEIIELGYETARRQLDGWKATAASDAASTAERR